ncbi:hypothetical protein AHMF7605_29135 [Adhaeribacter arboris]|uniref:Uncharacterized protein n=1 Tax=Adhaeribacter arboris TaxID=2072846 RepID=A0A2T2Y8Y7_9BACT|nr:hypothetical protein AHMF7605_29135 [Adhaeribacter arboris]
MPPREYFPGCKEGSKSDKIASKDILLLFNQCKGLAYYSSLTATINQVVVQQPRRNKEIKKTPDSIRLFP